MIHSINYFFTKVFNIILYPFTFVNEFWGILFFSIISSFIVLFIYKHISSPSKIKDTKEQIKANILAIRIYKDFWKVIVTSFLKSLFYTGKYFLLNIIPLIIVIPLMAPIFSQMMMRYEMKPYTIGDEVIIKAKFYKDIDIKNIEAIINGNGLLEPEKVITGVNTQGIKREKMLPVYLNAINEIDWKMKVVKEGNKDIILTVNGRDYKKSFVADKNYRGPVSEYKFGNSNIEHIIYPGEDIFNDDKTLEYINIYYKGRLISFMGIHIHWLIHYLVLVLIIVLALKKKFGVEF